MNERIKQLAEKSGFHFYDLHDVDGEDLGETVEADSWSAVDKFAELIVRECAAVCKAVGTKEVKNANESYNEGRQMGAEVCHNQIKRHFGIEE